jgi:general secretion pathway protein D
VSRANAPKRDLPVEVGAKSKEIPRKDAMVTQIMPVRYGEAAKLVENLRPLLSEQANITANEGSNSILLTDTQNNIHRIALIIEAIDTSVSGISSIRVFPLRYADATKLAAVITQLFTTAPTTGSNRGGGGGGGGGFPGFGGFGGGRGGGGGAPAAPQSEARQAVSRVVAVADEPSNSLIVSATDDVLVTVAEVIKGIDTATTDVTTMHIFRLHHADATEMADLISSLYSDTTQAGNNQNNRRGAQGRGGFGQGGGGQGGQGGQGGGAQGGQRTERALLQAKVVAVGDPRTNSLLVTAAQETMLEISEMVVRLDATDAKKQRVYVFQLADADPEGVATVLRGMLNGSTQSTNQSTRLNTRANNGATMDSTSTSSGGVGAGGAGGGR